MHACDSGLVGKHNAEFRNNVLFILTVTLKPRSHQQQCRSNVVEIECYKSNDSFDKVETNCTCSICFDFLRLGVVPHVHHISGHPSLSATGRWDRESSPVKDQRSTTVPRSQLTQSLRIRCTTWPMCTGQIFPTYLKSLNRFLYSLCNFRGDSINTKRVICQNNAPSCVIGHTALCAYAESRDCKYGTKQLRIWNPDPTLPIH